MNAVHNFSGGPGALPESVIREASEALICAPGSKLGLLGISHRSEWFRHVVDEAERNVRQLLHLPQNYAVLFLQGGGTLQFSMVPLLLMRGGSADYLSTGYWSKKAIADAERVGQVNVAWDGDAERGADGHTRLPKEAELALNPSAAYLHYVSNETVEGLQFHRVVGNDDVLRVCDMSSDFLSRPVSIERFDLVYAHAQKNLGPSGVTLVILKRDLLEGAPTRLPSLLDYRNHLEHRSIFNTPPVFSIYVVMLVTRWLLRDIGGLSRMQALNERKSKLLYDVIDQSDGFYQGRAAPADRSQMNIVFRLRAPEQERAFLELAERAQMFGLDGHRSLGGIRASLYNAVSEESACRLAELMTNFRNLPLR